MKKYKPERIEIDGKYYYSEDELKRLDAIRERGTLEVICKLRDMLAGEYGEGTYLVVLTEAESALYQKLAQGEQIPCGGTGRLKKAIELLDKGIEAGQYYDRDQVRDFIRREEL